MIDSSELEQLKTSVSKATKTAKFSGAYENQTKTFVFFDFPHFDTLTLDLIREYFGKNPYFVVG